MLKSPDRPFDVILFGATGYTGKLVAEVLAKRAAEQGLRWALAGRDANKLAAVRDSLSRAPGAAEIGIRIADASDRRSLDAIAKDTRVVCTTVGPYARYGSGLVAACAAAGTDYCDLTGEVQWMRRMIDAHHEEAKKSGARIVHTCGFDSIPSDLGVWMVEEHALSKYGRPAERVTAYVRMKGGASGGTISSMITMFEEAEKDPSLRKLLASPYALDPEKDAEKPRVFDQKSVSYDEKQGTYTAPFFMAPVNTRVVRRSNALLANRYGRDMVYHETLSTGTGTKGALLGWGFLAGIGGLFAGLAIPPLRKVLADKVLPKPGEGPTAAERDAGYFRFEIVAEGEKRIDSPAFSFRAKVSDDVDPGYGSTAKMLAESALCLAFDDLPSEGGVTTPAAAMGEKLIVRLRQQGMTWDIQD